jgi:hypothetical protein
MNENKELLEEFLYDMLGDHTSWFEYTINNYEDCENRYLVTVKDLFENIEFEFEFEIKEYVDYNGKKQGLELFLYLDDDREEMMNTRNSKYFWLKIYSETTKLIK